MANNTLLKKSEQNRCEKVAASAAGLEGKRAAALLALNTGATQTAAAAKAGLTLGQVRYLLTIFRDKGMALFAATAGKPKPATKAKAPAAKAKAKAPKKKKAGKDVKKGKKDKSKKKEKSDKKKDKKSKKKK